MKPSDNWSKFRGFLCIFLHIINHFPARTGQLFFPRTVHQEAGTVGLSYKHRGMDELNRYLYLTVQILTVWMEPGRYHATQLFVSKLAIARNHQLLFYFPKEPWYPAHSKCLLRWNYKASVVNSYPFPSRIGHGIVHLDILSHAVPNLAQISV